MMCTPVERQTCSLSKTGVSAERRGLHSLQGAPMLKNESLSRLKDAHAPKTLSRLSRPTGRVALALSLYCCAVKILKNGGTSP